MTTAQVQFAGGWHDIPVEDRQQVFRKVTEGWPFRDYIDFALQIGLCTSCFREGATSATGQCYGCWLKYESENFHRSHIPE